MDMYPCVGVYQVRVCTVCGCTPCTTCGHVPCGYICAHDLPEMTVPVLEARALIAGGGGGAWWPMPVILALGRKRQGYPELQRLGYLRSCFKKLRQTQEENVCIFRYVYLTLSFMHAKY